MSHGTRMFFRNAVILSVFILRRRGAGVMYAAVVGPKGGQIEILLGLYRNTRRFQTAAQFRIIGQLAIELDYFSYIISRCF